MWSVLILFLSLVTCNFGHYPIEQKASGEKSGFIDYRLPSNLNPIHYDLTVEPIFEPEFIFNGEVKIKVEVSEETNTITLHGHELSDVIFSVSDEKESENLYKTSHYNATRQFYTITLTKSLTKGSTVIVHSTYKGILNDKNQGFYRASYTSKTAHTTWIATTQFAPTYARQVFPCFDEPALKATFAVNIIRREPLFSVSNMPLKTTTNLDGDRKKDIFEITPKMSTYLVAFVVSDYGKEGDEKQTIYGKKEDIEQGYGKYALTVGPKALQAMHDFTGIAYTLNKIDHVAIPDKSFIYGAMENWGLVTYRESLLLYKEGETTASQKQSIAKIIVHEFSHQWFGNLVSPLWWDYLWLNEGFATYFDFYGTNAVESGMRMLDQAVSHGVQHAFEADSLETTRPMTYDGQTPDEIWALFDTVAYGKSGAVLRMLENIVTTVPFKNGIGSYLKDRQYNAATSQHLWDAIQKAVDDTNSKVLQGLTVKEIMRTWETQPGYPVVTVRRNAEGKLSFSQQRYLLHNASHNLPQVWHVPINYATQSKPNFDNTEPIYWLKTNIATPEIKIDVKDWFIVNIQQTGYYRVNYDQENWKLISNYLNSDNFEKVHLLNRAQLINDAYNLAQSGRIKYDITLELLEYLSRETDYIPLYSFIKGLEFLNKHLLSESRYDLFQRYIRQLLQGAYVKLGTTESDKDTHTDTLARVMVLTWLHKMGHEESTKKLNEQRSAGKKISPDLETSVYCAGLQFDEDANNVWAYTYEQYSDQNTKDLRKNRLITAMGCSSSTTNLKRYLRMTIGDAEGYELRKSDRVSAFAAVYSSNKLGLKTALDFFIDRFDTIKTTMDISEISSILNGISSRLTTVEQKQMVIDFVSAQREEIKTHYKKIFNEALDTIETNIRWSQEFVPVIMAWLERYFDETTETTKPPIDGTTPGGPEKPTEPSTETTTPSSAMLVKCSLMTLVLTAAVFLL